MITKSLQHRRGFTLVELMIVVSVLGILAAIVIPKLSSATDVARANGAKSQLTSVRKQLEVWKLDHNGEFPTLAQLQEGTSDWGTFTGKTNADGTLNVAGDFGPYFPSPPTNPYTNSSLVVAEGAPVDTAGWTYNDVTGVIRLVLPASLPTIPVEFGVNDYEQTAD